MVGSSASVVQAANEYFDALVKSRFIEMFGDPSNNTKWESKQLKEITSKIGSGATPKGGKSSYIGTDIAFIRSMNVHDCSFLYDDLAHITVEQADKLANVIVEPEDILFNITGASVARCCIVPDDVLPARVNQHVSIIRLDKYVMNPIFFNTMIVSNSMKRTLLNDSKSNGATREAITKEMLSSLEVIIPPIELQNQFADFVKQVDKSKLLFQQVVSKYDELVKSRFIEMFGDPLLNTMNWKTKTLDEITVKIRNGTTPVGAKKVYTEGGVIFLQSQNVWRNKIDYSDTQFISYELNQKMIDTQLEIGDVLITKTGRINTENSSLGRVSLFRGSSSPVNISSEIYLVRVTKEINPEFLMHLLLMDSYQKYIRTCSPGGTDKRHLYSRYVEKFIIIQPPIELQNQFADFVRQVDKSKSEILEGIKRLKTNRITEQ